MLCWWGNLDSSCFSPHVSRPKNTRTNSPSYFRACLDLLLSTNLCHCDSLIMVFISSKTLIQAHAVFLLVIAGYLIKSPEVITDCDLVFMMGEALKIDFPSLSSPQQSPFTFCAILIFVEAMIDLVLLSNIPFHEALDEALPYIRPLRNGNLPAEDLQVLQQLPEYITKSLTIYWSVWIAVAAARFGVYAGIAFFIYQGRGDHMASSYTSAAGIGGLDRLKNRVVFSFAFFEMMFWFWNFATLREERQERLTKLLEDSREM
ncbi:Increased loss of mitochondrial DNA protein 1 [Penicillium concentricum]|uniref:Increased loss of mitochondrial DNA protein 1 n=1 Tax=Penicillium concentricum TaxID=293559 RepID=A0A9W9SVI2_9EURO|nr:Increased loss of mitochondrial DNA protein 1 [Penicillium concentricum]KAJ5385281.1 Increased loss of mitochondrial DNA protein 1 [Penicillium concentricum]